MSVFIAGLVLFIYAFRMLEESLRSLAGRSFKKFLQRETSHKVKAVLGGTLATATLQSNSLVMMLAFSFVSTGVITLSSAIALVLGANLGITFNSWLIAWFGFNINADVWSYYLLVLALPGIVLLGKHTKLKWLTDLLVSFSLLFIGLSYMKIALNDGDTINLIWENNYLSPYWFLAIGILVSLVLQSGFATITLIIAMVNARHLSFEQGAAMAIASEVGPSVKLLLTSLNESTDTKKLASANLFINLFALITGGVLLIFLPEHSDGLIFHNMSLSVACFNTIVKLLVVVMLFPFVSKSSLFFKNSNRSANEISLKRKTTVSDNASSIKMIQTAAKKLATETVALNKQALGIAEEMSTKYSLFGYFKKMLITGVPFKDEYHSLKVRQGEQLERCAELLHEEMNPDDVERLNGMIRALRNIVHSSKNIKNIRANLKELSESENDSYYGELEVIKSNERSFYSELTKQESQPNGLMKMSIDNVQSHDEVIKHTLNLLQGRSVTEEQASTLLNIHREIYSSHKALIEVFTDLNSSPAL